MPQPKDYKEIFNHRGNAYHGAMTLCPAARREEFTIPIGLLDLKPNEVLCDFPSGGGYIAGFLPAHLRSVKVIALEASEAFAAQQAACRIAKWSQLPLEDGSVDAVLSLAALHHSTEREAFYREAHRVLRPGGRFLVGDVMRGSPQGEFLNGFVNAHNSMGHAGDFLDPATEADRMRGAGFEVTHQRLHAYPWEFPDQATMAQFCAGLFGLDRATPDMILDGLRPLQSHPGSSGIDWALLFIRGQKSAGVAGNMLCDRPRGWIRP